MHAVHVVTDVEQAEQGLVQGTQLLPLTMVPAGQVE